MPSRNCFACCLAMTLMYSSRIVAVESLRLDSDKLVVLDLPTPPTVCEFAPQSGRFIIGDAEGALRIYAAADWKTDSIPLPKIVNVGGTPQAAIVRQTGNDELLFVSTDSPPAIVVVDMQSLKLKKRLILATAPPRHIASSQNAADPWIYGTAEGVTTRYDMANLSPSGFVRHRNLRCSVSADGTLLYYRADRQLKAVKWPDPSHSHYSEVQPETIYSQPQTFEVATDPDGRFVAVGNDLRSPDLSDVLATMEFEPRAFMTATSLLAGFANNFCLLGTADNGQTLLRLEFPEESMRDQNNHRSEIFKTTFADSTLKQFFAVTQRHVVAIPVPALAAAHASEIWTKTELPSTWPAGKTLDVDFGTSVSVAVAKPADGMTVDGGRIQWTPSLTHAGTHSFSITIAGKTTQRSQNWDVEIEVPFIQLPFHPQRTQIAPSGDRILAISADERRPHASQLAVVEFESGKLLVQKSLACSDAVVTDDAVIVHSAGKLLKLDPTTLELQNSVDTPNVRAARLVLVGDKQIDTHSAQGASFVARWSLPGLERRPDFLHDSHGSDSWPAGRCGYGWVKDGILWDAEWSKPRLLLWPIHFRRHGLRPNRVGTPHVENLSFPRDSWYPCVSRSLAAFHPRGTQANPVLPPDYASILSVVGDEDSVRLEASDLHFRKRLGSVQLRSGLRRGQQFAASIATIKDYCVVTSGDRLMKIPLSALGPHPQPFLIEPVQSQFLLSLDEPNVVRYSAPQATMFHLASSQIRDDGKPLRMKADDGEFHVVFSPQQIDECIKRFGSSISVLTPGQDAEKTDWRDRYLSEVGDTFRELFGRAPTGIPVPIEFSITAEGPNLEIVTLLHHFLIEVPKSRF